MARIKTDAGRSQHHRILGKAVIEKGVGYDENVATDNGVRAERLLTLGFPDVHAA